MTMTQKATFTAIRDLGMTARKTGYGDEIRVAFHGANAITEPSAAYVEDLEEALSTAQTMAAHPTCPLAAQARASAALRAAPENAAMVARLDAQFA
jgi:hypothetical protein